MKASIKYMLFALLLVLLNSGLALAQDEIITAIPAVNGACANLEVKALNADDDTSILIAAGPCGGNLNCGFNTGCAPGQYYCCPRNAPYLNMCNCSCYARKNYNTSKGGCNVWHNCK